MKQSLRRTRPRLCPTCGRLVYLNRAGLYRRHFADDPDGRRHLCPGSGHDSGGVMQLSGLRGLDP